MSASNLSESVVEDAALGNFAALGYSVLHGPLIAPNEPGAERTTYQDVTLNERLRHAIATLNPQVPADARDEAFKKALRSDSPTLLGNNRAFHKMLVEGVPIESRRADGSPVTHQVRLIDFDHPEKNDFVAVNQFTVIEGGHNRRPDLVVFVNGLPLAVIELKNAADEDATIWNAFNQLQTYKHQIPSLFAFNEILIISDGMKSLIGSLTADKERFMPWRTIEGEDLAPATALELDVVILGVFEKSRFLRFVQSFVVFEEDPTDGIVVKKIAGYHQFHAVNKAVETTITASRPNGNSRCGVVWHTQGSGKSLAMVFYAGRIVIHPAMENPTVVVLTDRNDLDDQLYGTFSRCSDLLRQKPVQALDRVDLRKHLSVASGGVVFTTIQKFLPPEGEDASKPLTDRRNVIVIADEAHRSQYELAPKLNPKTGKIRDGFAHQMRVALPHASFIGFTATPIERSDANTRAVFGNDISIYDIQRAVDDGATVQIYYESRLAKLGLKPEEVPKLDASFEEVTEGEEASTKEKLKSKWAALEAIVGSDTRLDLIAADLVAHFEARLEAMEGKAMLVCMSRRICVELYKRIHKLRPDWHDDDPTKGAMKVVMTGSAEDPIDYQPHIHNKPTRRALADRFKDPSDPFKLVIVRDMWLTGFDAPSLHTMYADKPMQDHGLMQAITRVNRVFKDKPGGLIVDYLGLADQLKKAVINYSESGGKGRVAPDKEEAVAVLLEKHEICCNLFHGLDWSGWTTSAPLDRLRFLPIAQEHILTQEDGKNRLLKVVTELSLAFALSVPHPEALAIRDDVGFFQAVRAALSKSDTERQRTQEEMDHAVRQLVSRAVSSEGVIDIFSAAGLNKPDISILSESFLAEVRDLPQKNLAVELLRKLLHDEIKTRSRQNLVQSRLFSEMLEKSIRTYQNRSIAAAQIIEELIALAEKIREAHARGEKLGLTSDELAFYDALETNDSAVMVLGDEKLRIIAQALVQTVRQNVTIDWTVKETVRAKLRVMVKRILNQYGYPPDKQARAAATIIEQAERLCVDWAS